MLPLEALEELKEKNLERERGLGPIRLGKNPKPKLSRQKIQEKKRRWVLTMRIFDKRMDYEMKV